MNEEKEIRPGRNALRTFLLILGAFLLYAYAVEVTRINLEEPLSPRRQESTIAVLRLLARPDFFEREEITRDTNITVRMPCPEEIEGSRVTIGERAVLVRPNCVNTTQDPITLTAEGFQPNAEGVIRWYPPENATTRGLVNFKADDQGRFETTFTFPDVRTSEEPQRVEIEEVLESRITGLSDASKIAWERIIETVLMALMASTIGTILAVPLSFIAARNLMINVSTPLAAIMAALVAIPIGGWLAGQISATLMTFAAQMSTQTWGGVGAFVIATALTWPVFRLGPPVLSDEKQPPALMALSVTRLIVGILLIFFGLGVLANLGLVWGSWLDIQLGPFGFIGNFIYVVSDFIRTALSPLMVFVGALVSASFGSRYGQEAILRMEGIPARLLTAVLAGLGTAVLIYGIGAALNWLYLFDNPQNWTTIPAAIAGGVIAVASLAIAPKYPIPIGMVIYTISRTILNALRSIEPLIMGIVFVVWVGLGPFAGILALTLHSIAALGKLFSEQVESISEGPLEAITATGANRIQTIVYAVVPQIIPPYIAFTFYRWDINVRMSTIIGFVGGGGIGFVLQQNINLLRYRQASVMMIAIAVVVSLLDYVSSQLRSRII